MRDFYICINPVCRYGGSGSFAPPHQEENFRRRGKGMGQIRRSDFSSGLWLECTMQLKACTFDPASPRSQRHGAYPSRYFLRHRDGRSLTWCCPVDARSTDACHIEVAEPQVKQISHS